MKLKRRFEKNIHQFLADTNLFIAAIKNPKKETASLRLILELLDNINVILIDVDEKFLRLCKPYFSEDELIDIYHAATCLQTGSILITNDKHFDKIKSDKIIEVWNISAAIEKLGIE